MFALRHVKFYNDFARQAANPAFIKSPWLASVRVMETLVGNKFE